MKNILIILILFISFSCENKSFKIKNSDNSTSLKEFEEIKADTNLYKIKVVEKESIEVYSLEGKKLYKLNNHLGIASSLLYFILFLLLAGFVILFSLN